MVDNILGVVDAFQIFPGKPKPLSALRSDGYHDGLEAHGAQFFQPQIAFLPDDKVAIVMDIGRCQDLAELFPQAIFHFAFIVINAVFCQAAWLDITIDQSHLCPL